MSSRTCPDWPRLMEIAPDLQFMHYTVAEAQLPVDVLTAISHVSLGDGVVHELEVRSELHQVRPVGTAA